MEEGKRRQLIVCCDGTNNNLTGRTRDTNVSQLCELLAPDANNQLLYYDPGVGNPGTLPEAAWWDKVQQKYERLSGLAFGSGIYENIAEAYRFLMRNWREDDDIFLFGFSRGAFTARALGGLITTFGILRPDMDVMVPTLLSVYFRKRDSQNQKAAFDAVKKQISEMFAAGPARDAHVWFVGVWDTVESVGAPVPFLRKTISANPTIVGKRFDNVRHALALDEFRTTFSPRLYLIEKGFDYRASQQTIKQEWFAGCHSDVGGGYINAQAGLSQQTLLWMVDEAAAQAFGDRKLRLRPELLQANGNPDNAAICQFLEARGHANGEREKLVHSEIYLTPWWALAGMSVRNPAEALDKGRTPQTPPEQSPTVAENRLRFPANTQWREGRSALGLIFWAALLIMGALAAGKFLLGPGATLAQNWCAMPFEWMSRLPDAMKANICFSNWQLGWFLPWQWPVKPPGEGLWPFYSPTRAVVVDFVIIASYGYLLARACGWAFARLARLRVVSDPLPKALNMLGAAPLVAVLGDIVENLLTLLVVFQTRFDILPTFAYLTAALMTLAALAKWLGLTGSVGLIAWGCFAKRNQPTP
jgi:uncharacterized protein (DUF2235 family)